MIKKLLSSKTSKQTILLFVAQIFGMVIGFISNMLLAKQMGAATFGIYSFSLAIISFLAIFFEFGYFASTSRLLAINHNKHKEKELLGASIVLVGGISILFFVCIFGISFFVDDIFEDKVGSILRIASVVSWSFVIPFFMDLILKGSNHIEYLAGFNLASKIIFIIALLVLYVISKLAPINVLYALSFSYMISASFFIVKLNPSFSGLSLNIIEIRIQNKTFGFKNYISRVIGTGSFQLDRLMLGYFVGATEIGFYSLANSMANPINSFSTALGSAKFKDLANSPIISQSVLKINVLWIVLAFIGANSLGYIIVHYFLSNEYSDVFWLLIWLSLAVCFQSAYQPYNAWMGGHGMGQEMLIMSINYTIFNLVGNILLIYLYGAIGAALSTLTSNVYFLLHSIIIYKRKLYA